MSLHPIDLIIIFSKRASKNIESYFLGGNTIPWYMLGLSNASGMFDISGTMWMVYLLFVYGLKSIWIPWLRPVFNQIFLMVYLSIWLRRSQVMTGAEWIKRIKLSILPRRRSPLVLKLHSVRSSSTCPLLG